MPKKTTSTAASHKYSRTIFVTDPSLQEHKLTEGICINWFFNIEDNKRFVKSIE
jgi:hypothetical protein